MSGKRIFFTVLVIGVAAAGIFWIRSGGERSAPQKGGAATAGKQNGDGGAAMPVYTYTVQSRPLQERITATGSIVADEAVELVSEVSGKVVEIAFDEGTRVRQGDVLLKIDPSELAAQAARAHSRVELARVQAMRQRQLVAAGGTSQEAVEVAESEVQVLEAEAALAQAQLAKTEIRAPFDGVIGLRYVSVGSFLNPAARIATLQKIDMIKIEFAIAERHLDRVQIGAEVSVTVAGLPSAFQGEVYAIEPRIDAATRTLRLRARAENPGGKALPGGFATVELPLREIPNALLVPANAIVSGLNEQTIYVVENGRAQPRTVRTGLRLAREVQVVSGLEPGAVVITSGQMQLRPGVPVRSAGSPELSSTQVTSGTAASL